MKISELSRRTGVPLSAIKFYIREGLLPSGTLTAPNQAEYGSSHEERLSLIRALREVGRLPLSTVRRILSALDTPRSSRFQPLQVLAEALSDRDGPSAPRESPDEVVRAAQDLDRYFTAIGWSVRSDHPARRDLAGVLAAVRRLWEPGFPAEGLQGYADAAGMVADMEIGFLGSQAPGSIDDQADEHGARLLRSVVLGTILFERALVLLRRLAHEDRARKQWANNRTSSSSGSV